MGDLRRVVLMYNIQIIWKKSEKHLILLAFLTGNEKFKSFSSVERFEKFFTLDSM